MKKIFYFILTLSLLSITLVYAAPAIWGLALNRETKECAGYWPGDEFTRYKLPTGWKSYRPNYEKGNLIETEIGICKFTNHNDMKECCNQLGYSYVSNNIGKWNMTLLGLQNIIFSPVGLVIILFILTILFFLIRYFLKKRKL